MSNRLRIALLVNRDPTAKGVILTELRFFNTIFEGKNYDVYLVATSDHYMKIAKGIQQHFTFPTKCILIENFENRKILDKFHAVITWTMACNFYGGAVSPRIVEVYKLISYFTNEVKRPVLIRLPDSEIQVLDYRKVIKLRFNDNQEDSFYKMNKTWVDEALSVPEWNYDHVYWLANGRQDIFDWIVESVWEKAKEPQRVSTEEQIKKNSIYISDDIFFEIRKLYNNYSHLPKKTTLNRFGYVGFFTTLNKKRAVALSNIWKQNKYSIPIDIRGKGTEEIKHIGKFSNVDIKEGTIKGDDYWNFMNQHLAYVFVGKGNPINRYINKTIYDCVIARTPVVLYRPCDTNHVGMKSDEMYFETEEELLKIYEKLLIPAERERIIDEQKKDVFSRLSEAVLDLSFIPTPEIDTINEKEIFLGSVNIYSWAVKKPALSVKSVF